MGHLRLIALLAALASGCDAPAEPAAAELEACGDPARGPAARWFEDVTARSDGFPVAAISGGVIVEELSGDGRLDVVSFGPESRLRLHVNRGGLRFEERAAAAGLPPVAASAGAAADLDGDGDADLVLAARDGLHLFDNLGDGSFVDRTAGAGVAGDRDVQSILPADLDGDGVLDLYLGVSAPPPRSARDRLYQGLGSFRFRDVTAAAGVAEQGLTWAVSLWDADLDGRPDVYVANDTLVADFGVGAPAASDFVPDALLLNRGSSPSGTPLLADGAPALGLAAPRASMGGLVGDFDGDGELDLYVSDYGRNELYLARGGAPVEAAATFAVTAARRLGPSCPATLDDRRCLLVSWGAALADLDLDAWDELLVLNAQIETAPPQPAVMYRARPGGAPFEELSPALGCLAGQGLITADLDDDGDLDLVITTADLFETHAPPGRGWLRVRLDGSAHNRAGLGARVAAVLDDGRRVVRLVGAGGVVRAQGPAEAHFGSGAQTVRRLEIIWPSGRTQTLERPAMNRTLRVREP